MANVDRTRFEVLRRRQYSTTGTDVINIGDLLVVDSGNARPASIKTATGGSAASRKTTVQDAVADTFIGVALNAKLATATPNILVAVDCVAEHDLPSGLTSAQYVGDKVEIHDTDDATTGVATPQIVGFGTTNPIGKLAKNAAVGDTTVTVHYVGIAVAGPVVAD
jgi:hypothetical protein